MPEQIDLVVGIPRSGLVAASFLSLALNAPMTDLLGVLEDRLFEAGSTKKRPDFEKALSADRTVVVIDDAISSGRAFREARARIEASGIKGNFFYCSVYGLFDRYSDVDLVMESVGAPVVFEWSFMHSSLLSNMCFDIDGLLCTDCRIQDDDDGPRYRSFLENTKPLYKPTREIGYLVTARREKYRAMTEAWLQKHGIAYKELIMRRPEDEGQSVAQFKGRVYQALETILFVESEFSQSKEIADISGKPVLSVETQHIQYPKLGYNSMQQSLKLMPLYMRNQWTVVQHGIFGRAKNYAHRILGTETYLSIKRLFKRGRA